MAAADSILMVELTNDMLEIHRLVELTDEFGARHSIPRGVMNDIHLVLEEIVANVISYGLESGRADRVYVTMKVWDGLLTMRIEDRGIPFNPLDRPDVNIDSDVEDRPIGGLGIHLTKKLMDSVEYRREQDRNVLVITRKVSEGTPRGARPRMKGSAPMEVVKEPRGSAMVVRISGRLDILNSKELGNELQGIIDGGQRYLVLEMSGLEYVSSSGLRVLLQARKSLKPLGGTVVLCAMTEFVRKVVDTTGFTNIFKIFGTVEEALVEAPQ